MVNWPSSAWLLLSVALHVKHFSHSTFANFMESCSFCKMPRLTLHWFAVSCIVLFNIITLERLTKKDWQGSWWELAHIKAGLSQRKNVWVRTNFISVLVLSWTFLCDDCFCLPLWPHYFGDQENECLGGKDASIYTQKQIWEHSEIRKPEFQSLLLHYLVL